VTYALVPQPSAPGPLAGIGVLVTRPARQAGAFAQKLAALGATPTVFPAIVILPPTDRASLDRALARLASYDLAFFVSANAVEYGTPEATSWPARLVAFAPGPGTAEALAAVGVQDVRIPATTFDSEGLLALPELADVRGKRAVIFHGEGGRETLAVALAARGAHVDHAVCYRRAAPSAGAAGLLEAMREGRVHAVTVTSSEGVDNLCDVAGEAGRQLLSRLPVFAPHPRIAARARSHGLHAIETGAGDAGLIAGLLAWAPGRNARANEAQTAAPNHEDSR
jgi:uroporphyrinogen-III synthase